MIQRLQIISSTSNNERGGKCDLIFFDGMVKHLVGQPIVRSCPASKIINRGDKECQCQRKN